MRLFLRVSRDNCDDLVQKCSILCRWHTASFNLSQQRNLSADFLFCNLFFVRLQSIRIYRACRTYRFVINVSVKIANTTIRLYSHVLCTFETENCPLFSHSVLGGMFDISVNFNNALSLESSAL